jgi:hypothetical protein
MWLVIVLGILGSSLLVDNLLGRLPFAVLALLVLCLWGGLFWLLCGYFFYTRMVTRVTPDGVGVDLSWNESVSIGHVEIVAARVLPYDPDAAGGRFVTRREGRLALWVAGSQCVELTLRDGRTLQIGTQKPRELLAALKIPSPEVPSGAFTICQPHCG